MNGIRRGRHKGTKNQPDGGSFWGGRGGFFLLYCVKHAEQAIPLQPRLVPRGLSSVELRGKVAGGWVVKTSRVTSTTGNSSQ